MESWTGGRLHVLCPRPRQGQKSHPPNPSQTVSARRPHSSHSHDHTKTAHEASHLPPVHCRLLSELRRSITQWPKSCHGSQKDHSQCLASVERHRIGDRRDRRQKKSSCVGGAGAFGEAVRGDGGERQQAMPFSSMIQEMKGEIGAISSRGLLRFRLGAHHAAGRAPAAEPDAALRESCWAHVPPELLRKVLATVEHDEARWPARRAVVACACVCRCWRAVVKEIVRVPEASGKLTFPISLKQPGPRDAPFKCFIRRNRAAESYGLYVGVTDALADDGKFLLAARRSRRPAGTEYLISLDANNTSKGTYIGKLRSNFLGTKFIVYDAHPPCAGDVVSKGPSAHMIGSAQVSPGVPAGNYPISHICYEGMAGARVPRKMNCVMDSIPVSAIKGGTAPTQTEFPSVNSNSFVSVPFFRKSGRLDSSGVELATENETKMVLTNKSPKWHPPLECWRLNFHGRVTVASVKNFQLVASGESDPNSQDDNDVILQFGKIGKNLFTMDYRYPISAFQAFAICLSNFDTKITRE